MKWCKYPHLDVLYRMVRTGEDSLLDREVAAMAGGSIKNERYFSKGK